MGRYPHKTKTKRKLVTIGEWAGYFGWNRAAIYRTLEGFKQRGYTYDPTDIYSVLDFCLFILNQQERYHPLSYLEKRKQDQSVPSKEPNLEPKKCRKTEAEGWDANT